MRISAAIVLTGILIPGMAFAAIPRKGSALSNTLRSSSSYSSSSLQESSEQAAAEAACKKSTGYTDAQLKRASLLQIFRKCVSGELREVENEKALKALQEEKQELINKATQSFNARFRGRDPNQRTSPIVSSVSRVRTSKRISPRSLKAKVFEQQSSSSSASGL